MPILNSAVQMATKPVPRIINPKTHAIIDYIIAGSMLTTSLGFWRRNKRAAIAALIGAGTAIAVDLLTDYPGGVRRVIKFARHRDIDLGIATMIATLPEFLSFKDEREKKFFLAEGALITAISQLTQAPVKTGRAERKQAA